MKYKNVNICFSKPINKLDPIKAGEIYYFEINIFLITNYIL